MALKRAEIPGRTVMNRRPRRYGLTGLIPQPHGTSRRRSGLPAERALSPPTSSALSGLCVRTGGSVPAGSPAIVTIRADHGARKCLQGVGSVQSVRLTSSATRSDRSE